MPENMISSVSKLVFTENWLCPTRRNGGCESSRRKLASAVGDGQFADRTFTIWECTSCQIGFTDPVPSEETSHLLYEDRESNDFQPDDPKIVSRLKAFAAKRDARRMFRDVRVPDGSYVLDFGCGNGAFSRAVQELYPRASSMGADSHPVPPNLAESSYYSYNQLRNLNHKFDVILCRHVLEHTYDPVQTLTFLRTLLTDSGTLIIEVPSLETKVKSLFGKYWDGYYAPFHPLHFTRRSLARVLELAGFEVTRQGSAEMPKMGRSIRNVLNCRYGPVLFALGMLLQPVQVGIGLLTGTSVCLRAWARPAGEFRC